MKNKLKEKNTFLIEKLLKEVRWSKSELARTMNISSTAIDSFLKTGARTVWKQKEYTEAFNECFETDFSYKELFSLVD